MNLIVDVSQQHLVNDPITTAGQPCFKGLLHRGNAAPDQDEEFPIVHRSRLEDGNGGALDHRISSPDAHRNA